MDTTTHRAEPSMFKCNYPDCDGGPSTRYCHVRCRETFWPFRATLPNAPEKLELPRFEYQELDFRSYSIDCE